MESKKSGCSRATVVVAAAAFVIGGATHAIAAGTDYPNKPIRLVVPFAPGGSTDTLARQLNLKLVDGLGQQVVLDNRSGGNGTIGTTLIARAAPDGYTIGIAYIATFAINPGLYADLPYDPVKDFAPITQLTSSPNVIAVHPGLPAQTFKALVALAKAKPEGLNYATGGVGTIGHLSAELLNNVAGIKLQHIAYKGSGQAVIDLLGGHVPILFGGMSAVHAHAKAGKLRLLAVTGRERSPATPEVPTIAESGYPQFEAVGWFGVVAPAGTPKAVVNRLNAETVKAMHAPDVKERLTTIGFDVVTSTPEQFGAYVSREAAKWKKLVRDIGLKANG